MITRKNGFTLIELLVVIGIIAILSTLIVVYFNTAKMSARDSRRLADVKQVQLALKMYYNDVGIYPTAITAGNSIANGGTNYLLRVPSNPTPRNDNTCPDQEYQYKQLESGARYSFSFCLGDKTDDLDAGMRVATANGILNCPTGYVAIPGSSTFDTNDFCVMKYEAKCASTSAPTVGLTSSPTPTAETTYDDASYPCTSANSRLVTSLSSGYPIANVTQATASTRCQALGGHLMTNAEWMTITRNIEQVNANWSTSVGTGYMNIGNYGVTDAMDGSSDYGSGGGTFYYRRAHTLSSTDTIVDIGGNVAEILASTCNSGTGIGNYESTGGPYVEWNSASSPDLSDYEKGASGPSGAWTSTENMGKYRGCDTSGHIFVRGAQADSNLAESGIFKLHFSAAPSSTLEGFRCVK